MGDELSAMRLHFEEFCYSFGVPEEEGKAEDEIGSVFRVVFMIKNSLQAAGTKAVTSISTLARSSTRPSI